MRVLKNNFNLNKPYKVVAVWIGHNVKFKIMQPLKLWLFGHTVRYYNVSQWRLRERYKSTILFKDQKEVNEFIENQKVKIDIYKEIIVFDSLRDS